MKAPVLAGLLAVAGIGVGIGGYYQTARSDAIEDSRYLERLADRLIAKGRTGESLGPEREAMLVAVVGSMGTSLSQSLAERLGFEHYRGGIAQIRASGYAQGLEERLSLRQITALWLETVEMGSSDDGWMQGFIPTSVRIYGRLPERLTDAEFLRLAAVVIAPRRYRLDRPDPALDERVARLQRLLERECEPRDESDVWLEDCAAEQPPN